MGLDQTRVQPRGRPGGKGLLAARVVVSLAQESGKPLAPPPAAANLGPPGSAILPPPTTAAMGLASGPVAALGKAAPD